MATGVHRAVRDFEPAPLVLLVDDHEDARAMYSAQLEWAGLQVTHAVDGEHALWKVMTAKPDVVVMDLAMPSLDGWEATRAIRSNAKTRHIP